MGDKNDLSELEAAIAAGLQVADEECSMTTLAREVFKTGVDAFAAYREQVSALKAENARLKAFVKDCTTAIIYVDGQPIRLIDGDVGRRAAAVLAEEDHEP